MLFERKKIGVKMIVILISLAMAMPLGVIIPGALGATDIDSPGSAYEHRDIVEVGQNVYEVWIDGINHNARLMFSVSEDMGETWSKPIRLLNDEFVPMTIQMETAENIVHITWMDGLSRDLRTGYMSFNTFSEEWSKPIMFTGESPSLSVAGKDVAIALRHGTTFELQLSKDTGQSFESLITMPDIACIHPAVVLEGQNIYLACDGWLWLNDEMTDRGIYFASYEDGNWNAPSLVEKATATPREISMELTDTGIDIFWTEVSSTSIDSYSIERFTDGTFGKKVVTGSEPVAARSVPASSSSPHSKLPPKLWTFICYLDADNNLDSYGWEDMNEMEVIGSNADINIIVLFDGDTFSGDDTYCYYIEQDPTPAGMLESDIISTEIPLTDINPGWGTEINMADYNNCVDFIEYVYTEYPSDRYILDMWNHGGTWDWGMCSDDTSGGNIASPEVKQIYEDVRASSGKVKLFDIAGYDECLMADVCLYYDEGPYIDYMCNSEDSIGGDGWEYNYVLGHLDNDTAMSSEEMGFWIFQSYVDRYGTSGLYTTMSVINTTLLVSELMPALNNLAQKSMHEISTYRADLQTCANNAEDWQGQTHQKDVYHFCENIVATLPACDIRTAAQDVLNVAGANPVGTQFGDAAWQSDRTILIHNQNTNEHGTTIYIASPPYNTDFDLMNMADTNWDEFYQVLWGADPDAPNNEPSVTITFPPNGGFVQKDTIVTITGTASDPDGDGTLQRVDVGVHSQQWDAATGITAWSYSWDTTGWLPGWYKIMARSYDGQDFSDYTVHDVQIIVDPTLPDLSIVPADMSFDNPTPNEGEQVQITATTWNINSDPGAQVAGNATHPVQIGFYYGNPASGGTLIGVEDAVPSILPEGTSGTASIIWFTDGCAGYHDVYAVADPSHMIPELTDANNSAFLPITVAGYNVDLFCDVNTSLVQAGAGNDYEIRVENTGTMTDTITLTIDNPTSWRANFNNNPPSAKGAPSPETLAKSVNYRTYPIVVNEIYNLANDFPSIVNVTVIGTSWEGNDIHAVKISDNVLVDEAEPEVVIMGMHHAREWMSVEVPMYYLEDLVKGYGSDPQATWMVDNREIFIIPTINPDGYMYSQTVEPMWRKNRRDNGDLTYGVDLNRNYDGAQNGDTDGDWGGFGASHITSDDTYCGPSAFSEPETQAIRDFIIARDPTITLSYHSHAEEIYWPWGYADHFTTQTPDADLQRKIAENMTAINGYTPKQSGDAYLTTGDTDDWVYGYNKYVLFRETFPFTIELDTEFQPPVGQIKPTCELNLGVNYYATEIADNPNLDSPVMTHTPLADTTDTTGPYTVSVDITTPYSLVADETKLFWKTTGSWTEVIMTNSGDTWTGDIPGQPDGTWMYYYVETEDTNTHRSSEPSYTPYASHRFFIGNDVVEYSVILDSLEWTIVNFTVEAPAAALPSEFAVIDVIGTCDNDLSKTDEIETITTVLPGLVVIDDDPNDDSTGITDALDNLAYEYDLHQYSAALDLSPYTTVIWDVGDEWSGDHFGTAKQTMLANYLDSGGCLYITGVELGYDIGTSGAGEPVGAFIWDYLCTDYLSDSPGDAVVDGVTDDEISDGFNGISLEIAGFSTSRDGIAPAPGADAIFYDTAQTDCYGVKCDTGTFRVVYTSFNFAQFSTNAADRDTLMQRILDWLDPTPKDHDAKLDSIDTHEDSQTYYSGAQDIKATVSNQGITDEGPFDVNCKVYRKDITAPYVEYLNDDMESGWTSSDLGTGGDLWQQDAGHAYAGATGWLCGNLAGEYNPSMDNALTSGSIDLTGAGTPLNLSFWTDYDVEGSTYDNMHVEINDGSGWDSLNDLDTGTTYYPSTFGDESGAWVQKIYDISAYAGQNVQLRFRFDTDSSVNYGNSVVDGWEGVYVDQVIIYSENSFNWVLVYDITQQTVGTMSLLDTQQLTWNYDFDQETDYRIEVTTYLPLDERPGNNRTEITITIVHPPADDVMTDSIDSHVDLGTYPMGLQDIITTVSNPGTNSQGPFDVNCEIQRMQLTPYTEYYTDDMESGWTSSDLSGNGDLWQQDAGHAHAGATGQFCGNLAGEYNANMDNALTSGSIDLTGAGTPLNLSFWTDYDVEGSTYDNMYVEINGGSGWDSLNDPDTGTTYYPAATGDESGAWVQKTYDISAYAGQNVQLRFRFDTDGSLNYGGGSTEGWEGVYVDDIIIYKDASLSWVTVYDNTQQTVGTMNQLDTQQLTWNYDFDTETDYQITITTLLPGDENLLNDQESIQISISGAPPITFDIPITVAATGGWQFISFPITATGGVLTIFDDATWGSDGPGQDVKWDVIYWYDPTDAADPWKSYNKNWVGAQDLPDPINNEMGFWLHITDNPPPGDDLLTIGEGNDPAGETVTLEVGWNLVGFPSNAVGYTAADLPGWGVTVTKIGYYNETAAYDITETTDGATPMTEGNAYWVYSTIQQPWNLP